MVVKKCIVCEAEFAPAPNHINRQICCSRECRVKRNRQLDKERSHTETFKKRRQDEYRRHSMDHTKCRLCGEPTTINLSTGYKSHYHDECILDDCAKTLRSEQKPTNAQYNRLYYRGFSMEDVREWMKKNYSE